MTDPLADVTRIELPRPDLPAHLTASPSEPIACHVVEADERVLFGTGYAFSTDRLLERLDDLGGIDAVVVEHGDSDHYGALPGVIAAYDPIVVIPAEDRGSLLRIYQDATADVHLADGDRFAGVRALSVRGHTLGNMAFVAPDRGLLVAGDTVVASDSDIAAAGRWRGPLAPPAARFNRNDQKARENLLALADLDVDSILLTHGDDVETGGTEAIDVLLADLELHWDR